MSIGLHICLCTTCMYVCLFGHRGQKGVWESQRIVVPDGCELPYEYWEVDPGPLREQ